MARAVGLDIGTFAVRAVELNIGGDQIVLHRFAQVTLPPGAVRNGEIHDVGAVSAAIRRLWREAGFKAKRVVIGVGNQRVIVRQAELPAMSEQDVRAALQFEAQELIPIPIDDAVLDFQKVDETVGPDGEPRMRILLAAAQRDMVRNHLAAVEGAGLGVATVDVVPFALVRALGLEHELFQNADTAEAVVCIGEGVTNVVVHENGIPRFVRLLLVGGGDITKAIADELNVDLDSAEELKRRADPSSPDAAVARASEIVSTRLSRLVEEIRGSLDYYMAQAQSLPIGRVVVTGGGSRILGVMERLSASLGGRVEPARPLSNLRLALPDAAEQLAEIEQLLTVPIGLALAAEVRRGERRMSLVPREVTVGREARRQTILAGAAVGGFAALLLALWAARSGQVTNAREEADEAEAAASAAQAEEAGLRQSSNLAGDIGTREAQAQSVLASDIAWTRVIQEVATVVPSDVWLTSFNGTKGSPDKVTFSGRGFDHTSTARWLLRVGELPSFTGLWVANSTKSGVGSLTTVTFASDANLTPAARSDRAKRFTAEAG